MSEEETDFPRVRIRTGNSTSAFQFNWSRGHSAVDQAPEELVKILNLLNDWTAYCISSLDFIPTMSSAGFFMVDRVISEKDVAFLTKLAISFEEKEISDGGIEKSFIFHEEDLSEVAKRMDTTSQMLRAARSVQRSSITSLISELDYFLQRLLKICATLDSKKFVDGSEAISVNEITAYGSIDDLLSDKASKKIADLLRGSHEAVFDWIVETFELEKGATRFKNSELFREFMEVCQRRHIMVHNGGRVNRSYIDKCKKAGLNEADFLQLGEQASVSAKYLMRATARVFLTGYFVTQMLIQKMFPSQREACFYNALSVTHDFLERDFTKMAKRVCEFIEFSDKYFDHSLRLKFGINRALCELFDPDLDEVDQNSRAEEILEKYDWSVSTPLFDLALKCIRRDFEEIVPLAKRASEDGLSYSDARTFVVFREARNVEGFLSCFPRQALMIEKATG